MKTFERCLAPLPALLPALLLFPLIVLTVACQSLPTSIPTATQTQISTQASTAPPGRPAFFSNTVGDSFMILLPPGLSRASSARELFGRLVAPLVIKLGFQPGSLEDHFWIPQGAGAALPEPDIEALLDWTCLSPEVQENPVDQHFCQFWAKGGAGKAALLKQLNHLKQVEVDFFFPQVKRNVPIEGSSDPVPAVPIEHAGVFAIGRVGEGVRVVEGLVYQDYEITNRVKLTPEEALSYATDPDLADGNCLLQGAAPTRADLLLLPVQSDEGGSDDVPILRYAYRLQTPVSQCWLDAEDGTTLFDAPLAASAVKGTATVYHRSPATGATAPARFTVDDGPDGGQDGDLPGLALDGMLEIVPPEGVEPFQAADANFAAVQGEASAAGTACVGGASGGASDDTWRFIQADLYATLYRQIHTLRAAGIFTPFPDPPLSVELVADRYKAEVKGRAMRFGFDAAAQGEGCPDVAGKYLGASQDHTVVAHELGHLATRRLIHNRPVDWCRPSVGDDTSFSPPCPMPNPVKMQIFHDYADVWANTLEGTPCWGDWAGRNLAGTGRGEACAEPATEAGSMPRLATVPVPYAPAGSQYDSKSPPGEHFPERRCDTDPPWKLCSDLEDPHPRGPYGDGQLAATALWQLREGLASRNPVAGRIGFLVRFVRSLRRLGWGSWQCGPAFDDVYSACDQEVYRDLTELEFQLARQWADALTPQVAERPGAETFNEITAAFAKVGVFLIPSRNLIAAEDAPNLPLAPDAVVDIFQPEGASLGPVFASGDRLRHDGPAPAFHVWTGPRYRLREDGQAWVQGEEDGAPCNSCFRVEVTTDAGFSGEGFQGRVATSAWTAVNIDPLNWDSPQCYGQWRLPEESWKPLAEGERLYYRVTTRRSRKLGDCSGDFLEETQRRSTEPGDGLWRVPPPFAEIVGRVGAGGFLQDGLFSKNGLLKGNPAIEENLVPLSR